MFGLVVTVPAQLHGGKVDMNGKNNLRPVKQHDLSIHIPKASPVIGDDESPDIEFGRSTIKTLYCEIREHLNMDVLDPPENWHILAESVEK